MKHTASRELYAYWQEKRGRRLAPERAEIEPGAIRGILGDTFILALDRSAGHLWAAANRPIVDGLLAILSDECTGTVAGVTATNAASESIDLELLLLPLRAARSSFTQAIGVLAPLKTRSPWEQVRWAISPSGAAATSRCRRKAGSATLHGASRPPRLEDL